MLRIVNAVSKAALAAIVMGGFSWGWMVYGATEQPKQAATGETIEQRGGVMEESPGWPFVWDLPTEIAPPWDWPWPWTPCWPPRVPGLPKVFPQGLLLPGADASMPSAVDPGSLRVTEKTQPDSTGRQYILRERTWTSHGVQHHEVSILWPASPSAASGNVTKHAAGDGNRTQVPAVNGKPIAEDHPQKSAPSPVPPATSPKSVSPGTQTTTPTSTAAASVQVIVSDDSGGCRISGQSQTSTRAGTAVGVGVSVDSRRGTQIHHYQSGDGRD